MEVAPTIRRTRWLELRAWPTRSAPLAEPCGSPGVCDHREGEDLQVTLVVHVPLERLVPAVRPEVLPTIRVSQDRTGPWEEAIAWGACAAGATPVFWARRLDERCWEGVGTALPAGQVEAPDLDPACVSEERLAEGPVAPAPQPPDGARAPAGQHPRYALTLPAVYRVHPAPGAPLPPPRSERPAT